MMIDFGYATVVDPREPRSRTPCGTPEYLAPEMVQGADHGVGVDWWCVGVFTYECLVGRDPFSLASPDERRYDTQPALYRRITELTYECPHAPMPPHAPMHMHMPPCHHDPMTP